MENIELSSFYDRIGLNTNLDDISKKICKKYSIGDFVSSHIITIGYEDFNYTLITSSNKYCVKIFNNSRTEIELNNYIERITKITDSNINTPKPLKIYNKILYTLKYNNNIYNICVFQFIDGHNYYELNVKPTEEEIKFLARQTALINNIDYKPEFVYDYWAIINFKNEYLDKRKYIPNEYVKDFENLSEELEKLDLSKLPKGFVHGDIINTNVIKDKNNKLWIIDWSVSNYLPRIIDLAVLSCNMCLDKESFDKTKYNIEILLKEYNKTNELTDYELDKFNLLFKLANAMHIMYCSYINQTDGSSDENEYWLNEGKAGFEYSKKIEKINQ